MKSLKSRRHIFYKLKTISLKVLYGVNSSFPTRPQKKSIDQKKLSLLDLVQERRQSLRTVFKIEVYKVLGPGVGDCKAGLARWKSAGLGQRL